MHKHSANKPPQPLYKSNVDALKPNCLVRLHLMGETQQDSRTPRTVLNRSEGNIKLKYNHGLWKYVPSEKLCARICKKLDFKNCKLYINIREKRNAAVRISF